MRVAHLIWGFNVGGAELMLIDIVNEQVLTDEVVIFVVNNAFEPELLNDISKEVKVRFILRPPASNNPWYIFKLLVMLKRFKPHVIHAHQQSLIKIIGGLSIPKVLTVHDTGLDLNHSINKYNKIFSISKSVQKDLLKRYPKCSTTVVYNGINFIQRVPKVECVRDNIFRIVQVGRLVNQKKGQDIMLEALALVRDAIKVDVSIDFIGEGSSKKHLVELAQNLKLQEHCRFLGKRSREFIYRNLGAYDLLVQPSRNEGFGLTVVEAMAAQIPVLVSDIEGPMEIIEYGKYGYYFKNGDKTDCATKIIEVIKQSKESGFHENQIKTAEYAKKRFDIKLTAKNYLEEYCKLGRH